MRSLYLLITNSIRELLLPKALLVQALAIVVTAIIVLSGFDWWYFVTMHTSVLYPYFRPALPIGFFLPILLPILLYGIYSLKKKIILKTVAHTLTVSAFLSWALAAFYKALTGRIQPPHIVTSVDMSRQFNFGFFEHGIFWGWPSSHTTVAFATMVALYIVLKEKHRTLGILALMYAWYIGIAVPFQIH
jgi:hypothetical protein